MPAQTSTKYYQENILRQTYRWIVLNIIIIYLLGALFYADPFHIWQHALSEVGTTKTLLGTPNLPSAVIVMSGMFITGRLLLGAARVYHNNDFYHGRYLKSGFLYIASLGAFISIAPNNILHLQHTIGSAMLIGSIFLLNLVMAWEYRTQYDPVKINLVMLSLGMTIIAYVVTYFSGLEIKQTAQKICLANLLLVLYQRSRISPNLRTLDYPPANLGLNNP